MSNETIRVRVWSEHTAPRAVFPDDINGAVAAALLQDPRLEVSTAELVDPDDGLSAADLEQTDVLVWWGHLLHRRVSDAAVERIVARVREAGMGFVALHSAHMSKPYTALIEDDGHLGGVDINGGKETITVKAPDHPVARGISDFVIGIEESYDEDAGLGKPDTVVFHSAFDNGHEFRSGVAYSIGAGRAFYFRPGHEEYRTLYQPEVAQIIRNAVYWTAGGN
ncbi:trehalose utilization protein ThuA [Microlunatus endophyticus]|uniref:Trehalose utilization protein ThuA n=1 Tax=Microlunatus endophyticus TaxID=1716077 RepID=A0A917W4E2_9ACTN|nr:ThuA domain-containing protein [Microlunatus endophyticus]GGL66894.1 trehalose utilization protein ThuA [Microlunatus endophyticus]